MIKEGQLQKEISKRKRRRKSRLRRKKRFKILNGKIKKLIKKFSLRYQSIYLEIKRREET
jgi:hypothetical protein